MNNIVVERQQEISEQALRDLLPSNTEIVSEEAFSDISYSLLEVDEACSGWWWAGKKDSFEDTEPFTSGAVLDIANLIVYYLDLLHKKNNNCDSCIVRTQLKCLVANNRFKFTVMYGFRKVE